MLRRPGLASDAAPPARQEPTPPQSAAAAPALTGADRRALEKELASLERRLRTAEAGLNELDLQLATASGEDPYDKLVGLYTRRDERAAMVAELEERWLEVGERLEG